MVTLASHLEGPRALVLWALRSIPPPQCSPLPPGPSLGHPAVLTGYVTFMTVAFLGYCSPGLHSPLQTPSLMSLMSVHVR